MQDSLFFYQILLLMCYVNNSGIVDDSRQNYFSDVEIFSARYKFDIGLLGSYEHSFKVPKIDELVKFDGVVICDGMRGGSNGTFYHRWQYNGSDFDEEIPNSINLGHWLQIKRVMKLCNNKDAPKRGDTNYDPAYKFDFIYKAIVHNLNSITKWAELDQSGNETKWGHGGFGEKVSGLTGHITGKPGISKGGQIAITGAVSRIRPRVYVHCQNVHKRPSGFGKDVPNEARMLCENITPLIVG